MKLAVISDTHDHKDNVVKAVSIMNERNVEALIHCGDYCSPFVKIWFNELANNIKEKFYGVFGNNDGDKVNIRRVLGTICNIAVNGDEFIKEFDGKKVYVAHRPKPEIIDSLANSGKIDIILSGHTHEIVNKKLVNNVLIINPGEACGYLSDKSTFAIIDTDKLEAEIIDL